MCFVIKKLTSKFISYNQQEIKSLRLDQIRLYFGICWSLYAINGESTCYLFEEYLSYSSNNINIQVSANKPKYRFWNVISLTFLFQGQ